MYRESDPADAQDLYGRSKHLGEVDYPNSVTLRTSIIGHELKGAHGLVAGFSGSLVAFTDTPERSFRGCQPLSWRASFATTFCRGQRCAASTTFHPNRSPSMICCN